jgi:hypothetical protein
MKLKSKDELPFKYFLVKRDTSKEYTEYIDWLNTEFKIYKDFKWTGLYFNYYGFYGCHNFEERNNTSGIHMLSEVINNPKVFTAKEFMNILREKEVKLDDKKIIGYKAPHGLFNGNVVAGTIFTVNRSTSDYYHPNNNRSWSLPKEIVQKWEPVYGSQEFIYDMGSFTLTITPKGIFHKTENITSFVKGLYTFAKSIPSELSGYKSSFNDIILNRTGCENSNTSLKDWVLAYEEWTNLQ